MQSVNQGLVSSSVNLEIAFNNPCFADVTLKAGTDEFLAHKIILMSRSKVFAQMFSSDMKESKENVVDMSDMKASTVKVMLRYIYTGTTGPLTTDRAIDLYSASDRYDIPKLKESCKAVILKTINVESICDVAILAYLHSDEELEQTAKRVLKENLKKVLKTQKWRKFAKENPDLYSEMLESVVLDESDDNADA
ncbi:speckle-type POZ protein-like A [Uloborus diversus]|uniref:speckle-type POZ protein-like A n=1 Tax=Uloborus diversus TaxID=327109 RepID=UPI002409065F|nr:speckle-type POZ protein-like A [Uloborus diversus]